jgi:transcriptional regulator of heat shock response
MALVDEYVASAVPVASSRIAQQYLTEVSSATIRNELMGLETEGYVLSPHTSAGRIPTNTGYQVFVNMLLLRDDLKIAPELSFAGEAGLRDKDLRILDFERRVDRVLAFLSETTGLLSVLWCVRPEVRVYHRGMPRLLAQPEFQDANALIPLMQLIEDEAALAHLLISTLGNSGFVVKIGIKDEDGCLASYSLVAEVYGDGRPQGALAVFGPTRMDYRRTIPAVLLASRLLDYPRNGILG